VKSAKGAEQLQPKGILVLIWLCAISAQRIGKSKSQKFSGFFCEKASKGRNEMLNANDRCDRNLTERAYVRITKEGVRGEVILCKHHYEQNEDVLVTGGWFVDCDQRAELTPEPVSEVHA
jgi:hypothetical protein